MTDISTSFIVYSSLHSLTPFTAYTSTQAFTFKQQPETTRLTYTMIVKSRLTFLIQII